MDSITKRGISLKRPPAHMLTPSVYGVSGASDGLSIAVDALDEPIFRRLAGPREVERDVMLICPTVEIAGDQLETLIATESLRM